MKAAVYIATSVDGFIAREDGGIDWLHDEVEPLEGEDFGYQQFFDSVDALVMGRNTYEKVLSFGSWPYGEKPVIVLSSKEVEIPGDIRETVSSMSGPPREVAEHLDERGYKHLYIDGGKTIQGFLHEGLIDELIITKIPVLLGRGIPLFGPLKDDVQLHHIETESWKNGLVQSRYKVLNGED